MALVVGQRISLEDGKAGKILTVAGEGWFEVLVEGTQTVVKIQLEKVDNVNLNKDIDPKFDAKQDDVRNVRGLSVEKLDHEAIIAQIEEQRKVKNATKLKDVSNDNIEDKIPPKRLISILKEQVVKRNIIINTIREAYERDIILLRNQLYAWRENKPKHSLDQRAILDAVPSVDFGGCLEFFEPETYQLRFRKCPRCSGSVELIRTQKHRGKREPTEEEKLLMTEVENLKSELQNFKNGAKFLSKECSANMKRAELKMLEMKRSRDTAFEVVEKLKLKPGYESLEKNLENLKLQYISLENRLKRDIENEKQKVELWKNKINESNKAIDTLQSEISVLRTKAQNQDVCTERLKKELEMANNTIYDKNQTITSQRIEIDKAQARAKFAENGLDKKCGEMESNIEILRSSFQKSQKAERKAIRARDAFKKELESASMRFSMLVMKSAMNKWRVTHMIKGFTKWRAVTVQQTQNDLVDKRDELLCLNEKVNLLVEQIESGIAREENLKLKICKLSKSISLLENIATEISHAAFEEHRSGMRRMVMWKQKANQYKGALKVADLEKVHLIEKIRILERHLDDANDPHRMARRIAAATIIQTYRRAQLARREFNLRALSCNKRLAVLKAADAINTVIERKRERVYVFNIKDPLEKRIVACEIIQKHYRAYRGRKEFTRLNLDQFEEEKMIGIALIVKNNKRNGSSSLGVLQRKLHERDDEAKNQRNDPSLDAYVDPAFDPGIAKKKEETNPQSKSNRLNGDESMESFQEALREPVMGEINLSSTSQGKPCRKSNLFDVQESVKISPGSSHAQDQLKHVTLNQRDHLKAANFLSKVFKPNWRLVLMKAMMKWKMKVIGIGFEETIESLSTKHAIEVLAHIHVQKELEENLEKEEYKIQNVRAEIKFVKQKLEKQKELLKSSETNVSNLKSVIRNHEENVHQAREKTIALESSLESEKTLAAKLMLEKENLVKDVKQREAIIKEKAAQNDCLKEEVTKANDKGQQNLNKAMQTMQRISVLMQEVEKATSELKQSKGRCIELSKDLNMLRRIATNDAYRADLMQALVSRICTLVRCDEPLNGIDINKTNDKVVAEKKSMEVSEKLGIYFNCIGYHKRKLIEHVEENTVHLGGLVSQSLDIYPDPSRRLNVPNKRGSNLNPTAMLKRRLNSPEKYHLRRPNTCDGSSRMTRMPSKALENAPAVSSIMLEKKGNSGMPQFLLAPLASMSQRGNRPPYENGDQLESLCEDLFAPSRETELSGKLVPRMYSWLSSNQ